MIREALVVFFLIGSVWGDGCPPENVVDPCYCSELDGNKPMLICDYTADIDEIEVVLNRTRGMDLNLRFSMLRLNAIPSNFFDGQVGREIEFKQCRISSFEKPAFSGMEDHLERLEIYSSTKRSKLKGLTLGHLRKLREFQFEDTTLPRIENDMFRDGPQSLEIISLIHSEVRYLSDEAFASLSNLKKLNLPDNNLSKLQRSMFPRLSQLAELDLSRNKIADLPVDLFSEMPNLKKVDFKSNELTAILKEPWEAVWPQLEYVDFYNNPTACDQDMRWIFKRDSMPPFFGGFCWDGRNRKFKDFKKVTDSDFD